MHLKICAMLADYKLFTSAFQVNSGCLVLGRFWVVHHLDGSDGNLKPGRSQLEASYTGVCTAG